MSPAEHIDDKLVEYAYGELSPSQMRDAQAHLQTCARCTNALDEIRSVRRVMSQLPNVPAPTDGLDSLISYAQQRAEAYAKSQPLWVRWRRLVWPLAGAMACLALVIISTRVVREMGPVSSRLVPERQVAVNEQPANKTPELEEKPLVFLRAPPPVPGQKGNLAKDDRKVDNRASATAQAPGEALKEIEGGSIENETMERAPAGRVARREEIARAGSAEATSEKKASLYKTPPPSPPKSLRADDAAGSIPESSRVAGKLERQEKRKASPNDGVQGGVEGGVVGGVVGGVAGRQPASEEVVDTGQRSQPASPTVGFAQPPRKSEPAGTSESLRREATSVREALNRGAVGLERARLLNRLCEILFALGQELDAIAACDAVLKEFPDTPAAQSAKSLKANFSKASARPAGEKRGP